ncbi:Uncharacterised protein [Moraxella atlantae]|uniref:Uncharacterized protein n=1 Tax=Faucicola atlantae TaxID=34059 RepID=A0A378Q5W1_9GAMM|nr:hypothetical protein B5J92_00630 [Moraxella atlantae]STY96062.1 Uncharacterised protein [Moraxella atlantae]
MDKRANTRQIKTAIVADFAKFGDFHVLGFYFGLLYFSLHNFSLHNCFDYCLKYLKNSTSNSVLRQRDKMPPNFSSIQKSLTLQYFY